MKLTANYSTHSDKKPVGSITDEMLPESHLRSLTTCCGCGKPKDIGLVVCWECFKYRQDITPLKYDGRSVADWLNANSIGLLVPIAD